MVNSYKSKYTGEQIDSLLDAVIRGDLATFIKEFLVADWVDNTIQITYDEHGVSIPSPSLFRLNNSLYEEVVGGITIDSDKTIIIQSDLPFDGRVVVK